MARRSVSHLPGSTDGAVAPISGLALFALVAAGGIAFDYSRMATLDSELQSAADQAALASATQLDGQAGARTRATSAAQTLIANRTLMANDGGTRAITVPTVVFYQDKPKTTLATTDANAHFVEVTVGSREAFFALTPVVAAVRSGDLSAKAYAGLGSAICKVPPVMICNPQETGGNTSFSAAGLVGVGLRLTTVGPGGSWAPGNFGYLQTNDQTGANELRKGLGWTTAPGDCLPQTGVNTEPGASVSVTDALNTRFDIYDGNTACVSPGSCPSSANAVKDVVRRANASGGNSCKLHNQGWQEVASAGQYLPASATTPLPTTTTPLAMGHPRDICHAAPDTVAGYCTSPIGNGLWDRDAYFRANYGWTAAQWQSFTGLGATATRYQVYSWEIANRGTSVGGRTVLGPRTASGSGASAFTSYGAAVCSPTQGYGPGLVPGGTVVDRRRLSVAVVNCTANGVNGRSTGVPVEKWVDVFLVEPSISRQSGRTKAGDIYVEVIGETMSGTAGATAGQVVRRDVPYLIE